MRDAWTTSIGSQLLSFFEKLGFLTREDILKALFYELFGFFHRFGYLKLKKSDLFMIGHLHKNFS